MARFEHNQTISSIDTNIWNVFWEESCTTSMATDLKQKMKHK